MSTSVDWLDLMGNNVVDDSDLSNSHLNGLLQDVDLLDDLVNGLSQNNNLLSDDWDLRSWSGFEFLGQVSDGLLDNGDLLDHGGDLLDNLSNNLSVSDNLLLDWLRMDTAEIWGHQLSDSLVTLLKFLSVFFWVLFELFLLLVKGVEFDVNRFGVVTSEVRSGVKFNQLLHDSNNLVNSVNLSDDSSSGSSDLLNLLLFNLNLVDDVVFFNS